MIRCPNLRDQKVRDEFNGVLERLGGLAMSADDITPRQSYLARLNDAQTTAYFQAHYLWNAHKNPAEIGAFLDALEAVRARLDLKAKKAEKTPRLPTTRNDLHHEKAPETGPSSFATEAVPGMPVHRVATADGKTVAVKPVVMEAADLIASDDAGYDSSLQPRQRERAAAQQQVREIAARLDPERLGVSSEADRGAPIVGPDRMVESKSFSSAAALAMARAAQRLGRKYQDAPLTRAGKDLEQRASEAIKAGQAKMPEADES